jgi:hypothetical protein
VVERNEINGLLDAIENIKNNGKEHYSNSCRERAVNFFDKNVRFAEYIDLYQSLGMHRQTSIASLRHRSASTGTGDRLEAEYVIAFLRIRRSASPESAPSKGSAGP